jgi:hypothetical protein
MGLPPGLVVKRVEHRKCMRIEAHREPCGRAGLCRDKALRAGKESGDLFFLTGLGLEFGEQ